MKDTAASLIGYGMVVASIWFGWQMLQVPLADRVPPRIALQLAPSSPEVLRRVAEAEQAAGRSANAAALADESLIRAPFNARALRVRGLADAGTGRTASADQLLTLAGNWSLRDDQAHAWLVEYRLRRGNYGSAFAHADTLARRRREAHPQIFNLFTTAAASDTRAIIPLANTLSAKPNWRRDYISSLYERKEGPAVLLSLALALEQTPGPFETYELRRLYGTWASDRRLPAIRHLRERIGRPPLSRSLQNGDFSEPFDDQVLPFGWTMGTGPGLNVEMVEDDLRAGEFALRVEYDGFGGTLATQQMMMLAPGAYAMRGEERTEVRPDEARLSWTVVCVETGETLMTYRPAQATAPENNWSAFSASFTVPEKDCTTQWLRLEPRPGDRRSTTIIWFDHMSVDRAAG